MQPEPGAMIGPYKILSRLGAGGMGEVWRAHDTRLKRDVAIKTFRERVNSRFEREAQAVAALNHPNICHLYDVGPDYLVMELVEGRNLHGPLPLAEVLKIADQIAHALDATHEKGIVHRDLKPGNIRITPNGVVKVLDFGLALMSESSAARANDPDNMETLQLTATEAGSVMGTPAYLAPEQARGLIADKRADIWAFGMVILELLTGHRPFSGETRTDILVQVLTKDPDLSETPFEVRRLLRSCLEKDPRQRLRDIGDWRKLLDEPVSVAAVPPAKTGRRWMVAAALCSLVLGCLITLAALRGSGASQAAAEPVYRRLTDDNGLSDYPALSRDGKFLAYASDRGGAGNLDIWLQQIGGREAIQLTRDPDDETDPAFSPDGTRVAYRSERNGGGIYAVQALGGDPVLIAPNGRNPRYSPDGRWIVYWTGRGEGSFAPGSSRVFIIDANGGQPRLLHPEMAVAEFPVWSPRGDAVLVQGLKTTQDSEDFWVLPVGAGEPYRTGTVPKFKENGWRVLQIGMRVEPAALDWTDTGGDRLLSALLYGDSANLWETGLNAKGMVHGLPHRVTRGSGRQAHASWAITDSVERIAFGDEEVNYDIWTMPSGSREPKPSGVTRLTDSIATEWSPSLSADGKIMLYLARRAGSWAVILRNLATAQDRVLISSPSLIPNAVISPDGLHAAWSASDFSIFEADLTGVGQTTRICDHCGTILSLSSDGRLAAYEPVANEDLMALDSGEHKPVQLAARPSANTILSGTQISVDGRWAAFHSIDHATRTTQIWIAPIDLKRPAPSATWIAISDGKTFAQDPGWGPKGDILYFASERDGFRCYWAQKLDPETKHPLGEPFPVRHFHSAGQTLRGASSSGYLTRLSAGGDKLVFASAEVRGSIWLQETARAR